MSVPDFTKTIALNGAERTTVSMSEYPILFNTLMVQAILEGRKTATRRVIKPRYKSDEAGFYVITNAQSGEYVRVEKYDENESSTFADGTERYVNEPYQPGDILWVRETWAKQFGVYWYKAGPFPAGAIPPDKWRPSIHMPREAARIFLRVKNVRVARLQDSFLNTSSTAITFAAEGIDKGWQDSRGCNMEYGYARAKGMPIKFITG